MISVIMPTYNERDNIVRLIDAVSHILSGEEFEIVVVDDDSPDLTWKIAEEHGNPDVHVVRRTNERGLASAIREGIKESRGDIIVTMDTDFSHPPEVIPKLVKACRDYDVVVGSRYVKGGRMKASAGRVITSRLTNLFANIVLGFFVHDLTGGFLAVRKEVFEKVKILPKWGEYGNYCIGFLYACKRAGFRITEVPFVYMPRTKGETKTSPDQYNLLKWGWRYLGSILKLRIEREK